MNEIPERSTADLWSAMLEHAVRAPSSHNAQPWLFVQQGDALELFADRTRALPLADPEDRELATGCGAALFHLRLAAHHFGFQPWVEVLPDTHHPDLLARMSLRPGAAPDEDFESLFRVIHERRTSRHRFEERPVPATLIEALVRDARCEGAEFAVVRGDQDRRAVAELVAEADRIQSADRRFRRELAAWIHPNRSRSADGIPGYAMGLGDVASTFGPLVVRTFDLGRGRAARDQELATGSPVLALITTEEDRPPNWIAAGQALARVLLRARVALVDASFLNQPVEVDALRARLGQAARAPGTPQLLLRFGYGPPVRPTPRRGVREVFVPEPDTAQPSGAVPER